MANIKVGRKGKGIHMELVGYDAVHRGLKLMKNQKAALNKFIKDEGKKLTALAKATVPVDKRRLKDSHRMMVRGSDRSRPDRNGANIGVAVVAGGISVRGRMVDYAAAVHEGAPNNPWYRHMPPRPWLKRALEKVANGFEKRLAKAIKIHKLGL